MSDYKFILNNTEAHPIYSNDLALEYSQESNQQFYRKSLSGSLVFINRDFDYILSHDFETELVLEIKSQNQTIFTGYFYRTDCTVDYDHKKIEVKLNAKDEYADILAGLEKEYNLVDLKPEIENINLSVRGLLQIYQPGESVLSCFIGNLYWEQDCDTVDDINTLESYGFVKVLDYGYIDIVSYSALYPYISGRYVRDYTIGGASIKWTKEDNKYELTYFPTAGYQLYVYGESRPFAKADSNGYIYTTDGNIRIGHLDAPEQTVRIYSRMLSNNANASGDKVTLTSEDMCGYNRNYKYAYKYKASGTIKISSEKTSEPTEWGIYQPGSYYVKPGYVNEAYYPIARTAWGVRSFWYKASYTEVSLDEYNADRKIRDGYTLTAAIKAILKEIAPSIKHEATPEYSDFLYNNRMASKLGSSQAKIMICQKTNLINGEYQQPAQKANVTLSAIFEMLRNMYQCYWYIEGDMLKIEHIEFFKNGGSYDGIQQGIDLTNLKVPSNNKPWSYVTSKVSYEKEALPERYEFSQMDEVTDVFKGLPINMKSKYVELGKVETFSTSLFSSDTDYMLINPSAINNDGFALFVVEANNKVPIGTVYFKLANVRAQNQYAAMGRLEYNFWGYDLPGRKYVIPDGNVVLRTAKGIKRNKKQEISVPSSSIIGINPMRLIHTGLGDGQIEKLSINLVSLMTKFTLRYDTDS